MDPSCDINDYDKANPIWNYHKLNGQNGDNINGCQHAKQVIGVKSIVA